MSKKLMILGASILQLPAIVRAKELGHFVISVDIDKNAIGFPYADVNEVISTVDIPEVLKCAKRHNIDGIMTLSTDMPMQTVATVAEDMKIHGINLATAIKATDKAQMRMALRDANVAIPDFYIASTLEEYKDAVPNFSGKYIVKPADSSGSRGVCLVENKSQENAAFGYSKNIQQVEKF